MAKTDGNGMDILAKWLRRFSTIAESRSWWALLFIVLAVIMVVRRPDMLLNPQPLSEDGHVFIQGILDHSYLSFFDPYAGYLHLIPRIVTYFAMMFGLANAPLIMHLSALALTVICISYLYKKDFRFLVKNDAVRFLLCVLIVSMPTGETILNITNIQWPLAVYLTLWTLNLLVNHKTIYTKFEPILLLQACFLILAFLTCSLSFILIPFLVLFVALRVRDNLFLRPSSLLFLLPMLALFAHGAFCVINKEGVIANIDVQNVISYVSIGILSWFYHIGYFIILEIGDLNAIILLSLIVILVLLCSHKLGNLKLDALLMTLALFYIGLLAVNRPDYMALIADNVVFRDHAGRYMLYPATLLLLVIVRNIGTFLGDKKFRDDRVFRLAGFTLAVLLLVFLVNTALYFRIPPLVDMGYKALVSNYDPEGTLMYRIPINPIGWKLSYIDISTNSPIGIPVFTAPNVTIDPVTPGILSYAVMALLAVTALCLFCLKYDVRGYAARIKRLAVDNRQAIMASELILIVLLAGTFVYEKPVADKANAKADYLGDLDALTASLKQVSVSPRLTDDPAEYKAWLDERQAGLSKAIIDYYDLCASADRYKAYLDVNAPEYDEVMKSVSNNDIMLNLFIQETPNYEARYKKMLDGS